MLLDPFEEQFHLPATLVDLRDGTGGEHKIVGQKLQPLVGLRVEVTYAPQCIGIHRGRFEGCQNHRLIRAHARALVHRMRVASLEQHVRLGAHDKEGRAERKDEEPLKIDVAPVQHVEGHRLWQDLVEEVHIMHIPTGDADKCGNVAVQVQQSVHLDGGLAPAKLGPRKQRQAQVDGGRIQSVQTLLQIDANRIAGMQRPGDGDQSLREIGEDPPIMRFVRVGQRRARHLAAESQVVQLALHRTQTGLDVAQTFPIGQLREGHGQILIPAGKSAQPDVALIALDATAKLPVGKEADQLRKNGAALIHEPLSAVPAAQTSSLDVQIAASSKQTQLITGPSLAVDTPCFSRTAVVRSNSQLRRVSREIANGHSLAEVPVNKLIVVEEQRPASCPRCNSALIYRFGKMRQTVYDLKLSPAGVKRWVTRYSFSRFICWHCKATLQLYMRKDKYGTGLRAYLLYQIIELQIPQNAAAKGITQLFNFPLSRGSINRLKASEADRLERTYRAILERVVTGRVVHADETKAQIGGHDGYVWVFTNLQSVAFVYSETREATTPQ